MTIFAYNTTIFQPAHFATPNSADIVLIGPQAMLVAMQDDAFLLSTTSITLPLSFEIYGTVSATNQVNVIEALGSVSNVDFHVGTTGVIFGLNAISLFSSNLHVFNEGTIGGTNAALVLGGVSASGFDTTIVNYGTIYGGAASIVLLQGTGDRTIVDNHGTIGMNIAVSAFVSTDTTLTNDIIRNSGTIFGDVFMGGGNDLFDARGGIVQGTIHLGPGDDRYIPSLSQESVDGGTGTSHDILDFRYTSGVSFALDGLFEATGVADGDTYTGFAYLNGSNSGADSLRGDAQINLIKGGGGADNLDGAAGNDSLIGGNSSDTLTGGLGDDRFIYNRATESPDVILDFSNATGNNDAFQFVRATFDATLTLGTLAATKFQTRADNLAQDADDRFIWNTTDKTLWYDADGNGALGPIMIAHLQANATVTALDILII